MKTRWIFFLLFMSWFSTLNSQTTALENLTKKITNKQATPLQAYKQLDSLLTEAIKANDAETELKILSKRYEYDYLQKIDFEQMISAAQILKERAQYHNNLLYEAKAHKYLAQTYSFNELYQKSIDELQKAMQILEHADAKDYIIIIEKANIHTAFANLYSLKKEHFSAIQSLLNSAKEHEKLTNPEQKRGTQFMDYANLSGAYLKVNLDSAKYYANKSIALSSPLEKEHNLMFLNYLVLGNVYQKKHDYETALTFYKKAEDIKENKHFLNIKELYGNFIKIYTLQENPEAVELYTNKLKDLNLTITQNQNKSLRKIIQTEKENVLPKKRNTNLIWIISIPVLLGLGGFLFFAFKQKKRKQQTKPQSLTPENYNTLLELLANNDQTFLLMFKKVFPLFSQKLLEKAPDLSSQEIEILAMTKLGLSNKEIANYKFIQPKTVQNKRYLIRKKLNLSSDTDLNKWVQNLC